MSCFLKTFSSLNGAMKNLHIIYKRAYFIVCSFIIIKEGKDISKKIRRTVNSVEYNIIASIKKSMSEQGITQYTLERLTNIDQSYISKLLSLSNSPSVYTLTIILDALNLELKVVPKTIKENKNESKKL